MLKATREELKGGADFMKIMCGGGVASPTDAIETVQFTAEEIRAITTTARQFGTYVTAHAYTNESIKELGGQSGQEIRNWIAAYAALSTVGPYDITYRYYRPIPEFIAGFSVTTALPRTA